MARSATRENQVSSSRKVTRQGFLCDSSHRITVHFTPKHASWLNQVEIWFSILVRKVIRRGDFSSKQDLKAKIERFIDCLQSHNGKAIPMDNDRPSACRLTIVRLPPDNEVIFSGGVY